MAVLLATAAATLFMTGVGWFVQVVHYPLMKCVGAGAGLALASATWVSTAAVQVPRHRHLTPDGVNALVAGSWARTLAWTAHSALLLGMLAAVE